MSRKNKKEALTPEECCRAIFGDEPPVRHVWEPEFDYVFNEIGGIAPVMRIIWSRWWSLDSVGKAVCALQYAAYLIYAGEDNILCSEGWHCAGWLHPLSHTEFWSQENWAFLCTALTPQTILEGVQAAAEKLRGEPEEDIAARIAQDALKAAEIIAIQIEDVLTELACGT